MNNKPSICKNYSWLNNDTNGLSPLNFYSFNRWILEDQEDRMNQHLEFWVYVETHWLSHPRVAEKPTGYG